MKESLKYLDQTDRYKAYEVKRIMNEMKEGILALEEADALLKSESIVDKQERLYHLSSIVKSFNKLTGEILDCKIL